MVIVISTFVFMSRDSTVYLATDEVNLPISENYFTEANQVANVNDSLNEVPQEGASQTQTNPTKEIRIASHPDQLRIPSIKVDANVQNVGITNKGNMGTPKNFKDVGWYAYGAVPGEVGSSVIAGHVNNGLALPAVFANLEDVKIGEDIYIDTVGEGTLHFVVTGTEVYDFDAEAPSVFTQNDGKYLKLITCTGEWVKEYRTHNKRLVVIAELVE